MRLCDLDEKQIKTINSLNNEEKIAYFTELIQKFYSNIFANSIEYEKLLNAYNASFLLEQIYRDNEILQEGFTTIYTKTGLIMNITNDLYFNEDDLIIH